MSNEFSFEISFCESLLKRDPHDLMVMELLAEKLTKAGRIEEGLELDRQIVSADPENAVGHYNLACSLALTHQHLEALDALRKALQKGYREFDWMLEDPDLLPLHANPAFAALLAEFQNES